MSEQPGIAVIGAGVFGAVIALRLASDGYQVDLFEKEADVILGASYNNQNRLHLGFHYPRDLNTARQCVLGFDRFIREFPECISQPFPNAYFIAEEGSFTSYQAYLSFCDHLGVDYAKLNEEMFPLQVNNVSGGILCHELVYDAAVLRRAIRARLSSSHVEVHTNTGITGISKGASGYALSSADGVTRLYDAVVNCTYADINRLTSRLGDEVEAHQYEYTIVPVIKAEIPRCGVTVMDGPFMTLLPFGNSDNFLLYHVDYSVLRWENNIFLDAEWTASGSGPFSELDREKYAAKMIKACCQFIPALESAEVVNFLSGPRMVVAGREDTDERPSVVNAYGEGYLTVFSGKIDHSIWVADEVNKRLNVIFDPVFA